MAQEIPPEAPRLLRLAPFLPIPAGVAILASLAWFLHDPVHIAGDGALKHYLLRSWIETGRVTSQVAWASPQPWTAELWQAFHYPFEVPFLFDGKAVFPPFFLLLSLPLLKLFGYAGLFVLPCLSMIGLWALVAGLLRRSGVSGLPAALALTILVISPLTYFGMMFWEHTPGLLALFGGFALLTRPRARSVGDVAGGFLLALAVMLRPELAVAAALIFGLSLARAPRHGGAIPGAAAGLLVWASVNAWVTGNPLGIHARQPLYLSGGDAAAKLTGYYLEMASMMTAGAAGAVAGLVLGAALLWRDREDENRWALPGLAMAVLSTLLILPLMIPYSGEYLGFRRFELLVIPAGALMAGKLAARHRWALLLFGILGLLQAPAFIQQFGVFRWANGVRLSPVIEAIEETRPAALIADSQFTAIELSSQMRKTPLLWAPPPAELTQLIGQVSGRVPLDRIALVFWKPGPSTSLTIPIDGRGPVRWTRLAGDDEGFALFMPQ